MLATSYSDSGIKIENLIVEFKLIYTPVDILDIIPFDELFLSEVMEGSDEKVIINILINDSKEEKEIEKMLDNCRAAYYKLKEDFNMGKALRECIFVKASPNELEEFIEKNNEDNVIFASIVECLNDVVYDRAMLGKIKGTYEILDIYTGFSRFAPYALATRGLVYFRDTSLKIEESEQKGIEYYRQAMDLEHGEKEKYIKQLEQTYNFELARFYIIRKGEYKRGSECLQKVLDLGEDGYFYEEAIELQKELHVQESI
ncbi:hypothetical protein [Bacillus sp. 166amftsu]|uniref:hypothetical protein n=1 Tax=Bacillus sp. 166amftsu TaxID=1761753 RepID=UPI000899A9F0|nr:hypothetical protein [Bacillus sp. 166amftsu]SDY37621.1 hypothetical protein SAMN04488156_10175 [Bacillus sp. 166amftsu]